MLVDGEVAGGRSKRRPYEELKTTGAATLPSSWHGGALGYS